MLPLAAASAGPPVRPLVTKWAAVPGRSLAAPRGLPVVPPCLVLLLVSVVLLLLVLLLLVVVVMLLPMGRNGGGGRGAES